jgi:hypothetical protein
MKTKELLFSTMEIHLLNIYLYNYEAFIGTSSSIAKRLDVEYLH